MTASENLDRVRDVYAEWARGNMKAGPELFDPELAFEAFLPDAAERVTARGLLEVERFMREFLTHWRDYRLIGDEFRAVGSDTVLVLGHQTARGRRSGAAVEHPMSSVWTFRGGKVVHLLFEPDTRKVLDAAGDTEHRMQSNAESLRLFLTEQFSDIDLFVEAMKRGEVDLFDREIVYEDAEVPDHVGEVYRGYAGIVEAAEGWREGGGHLTLALREIVGEGDELVSVHRLHVKAEHSGIEFDSPIAYHWTFRDGKVVHVRAYRVAEEALAAAGFTNAPRLR